jgi:hypothetical protein
MKHIPVSGTACMFTIFLAIAFLGVGLFVLTWEFQQVEKQIVYVNGTVIRQLNGNLGLTTTTVQLDNGTTIMFRGCNSELYVGERVSVPFLDGMNLWEECFL